MQAHHRAIEQYGALHLWALFLYMRPRISIRGSVRPSVGPSIRNQLFSKLKSEVFLLVCYQGGPETSQKCRIASL